MKVNSKKDIIAILKEYGLAIDDTHNKGSEHFLVICDYVDVNEICFRSVKSIRFVEDTMWIDKASIDIKDVKDFDIGMTSVNFSASKSRIILKK